MATLQDVYEKVMSSDGERAAFAEAAQGAEGLASFLAERGCEASAEEVAAFLESRQGELADAELDDVAGGSNCTANRNSTSFFKEAVLGSCDRSIT